MKTPVRKVAAGICILLWLGAALPPAFAQTNFTLLTSLLGNSTGTRSARLPFGPLLRGSDGAFYGTTLGGGVSNRGTVFRLKADGTGFVLLKNFLGPDGRLPRGGVVEGHNGSLFGTTSAGGSSDAGTLFKLSKDGSDFTVLHHFSDGADGSMPYAPLLVGSDGVLYGSTSSGIGTDHGTLFKINDDGSEYGVLHLFAGDSDGAMCQSRLLEGSDGALYGTTPFGGAATNGAGTVFRLNKNGSGYELLRVFLSGPNPSPELVPGAGLIEGSDGGLYGYLTSGGADGHGAFFRLNKNGTGYTNLLSLIGTSGPLYPVSEFLEDPSGVLYGCSGSGGSSNRGTFFKMNADGSDLTILRNFTGAGGDGNSPQGALIRDSKGVFYGSTFTGGESNQGCVFALSSEPLPSRVLALSRSGTSNVVQFAATSAFQYDVQRSTNLVSWSVLTTLTAPFTGRFNYSDTNPPASAAFYRLKLH